jgi:hypothetical protein
MRITVARSSPAPPLFSTTKVEGIDGVYFFRYQVHQAMFVVTPDGVHGNALQPPTLA